MTKNEEAEMKHLEDEDIAGMIDGTISKKERENFLQHLSQCNTCFEVYTDTLKFIEKEKKTKAHLKLPGLETIAGRFKQAIGGIFTIKKLVPVTAALIIILLIGFPISKEIQHREIKNKQIAYIKHTVEMEIYTFSASRDKKYAAVRSGIFVEDLSLLVNTGQEELRRKIGKMLSNELKTILKNETNSLFQYLENIERKNFDTVVQRIRELMEKQSLSKLFQLGCFLEHCILSTFEDKAPKPEDIEEYQQVVREYNFPQGVSKELKKLEKSSGTEEIRKICKNIERIFFE